MRTNHQITDEIAFTNSAAPLRVPAFCVIQKLDRSMASPGHQILATAVALIAMCESANVPFDDLIRKAIRITSDVEGPHTAHLQAVRDYARHELRGA